MAIKSFEIISVPVSDQQRSKQFYRDVLGFELLRDEPMGPGQSWIQLAPKGCLTTIALVTWFETMRPGGLQGVMLNVTDIERDHEELSGRGLKLTEIKQEPWGHYTSFRSGRQWLDPAAAAGLSHRALIAAAQKKERAEARSLLDRNQSLRAADRSHRRNYISIPPMPPMPPPGAPCACSSSFGASAIMTSVVSKQTRHRGGVLQSQTRDLGRIQDAQLDHVAVLAGRRVVAELALALADPVQHDRGVFTGVGDDLTQRLLDRAGQDLDARGLVLVGPRELLDGLERTHQRHAAARNHAFFDRRTGRVQSVLDARLLLLHLDLGRRTDLDHGDAAGELGNALLQLLLVVVGGRFLDLLADALDAALMSAALPAPSMMVVFSFSTSTFFASPRSFSVAFSSDRPTSSEITVPPVRTAMSCSMALRRSPKPGALTAATLTIPRMVLTTSVASASPSTSSATISS